MLISLGTSYYVISNIIHKENSTYTPLKLAGGRSRGVGAGVGAGGRSRGCKYTSTFLLGVHCIPTISKEIFNYLSELF